jgi:hypothetical protein
VTGYLGIEVRKNLADVKLGGTLPVAERGWFVPASVRIWED